MKLRELLQKAEDKPDRVAHYALAGYLLYHAEAIADLIDAVRLRVNAQSAKDCADAYEEMRDALAKLSEDA